MRGLFHCCREAPGSYRRYAYKIDYVNQPRGLNVEKFRAVHCRPSNPLADRYLQA